MEINAFLNPESCCYLSCEKHYIIKRNALIHGENIKVEFLKHTLNISVRLPIWLFYIYGYQENNLAFAKAHTFFDYDGLPK